MTSDNKRKALYDALANEGYDVGTEESFGLYLDDDKKRRALYDSMASDGYDVGSFESFSELYKRGPETAGKTEKTVKETPKADTRAAQYPIGDLRNPDNPMLHPDELTLPDDEEPVSYKKEGKIVDSSLLSPKAKAAGWGTGRASVADAFGASDYVSPINIPDVGSATPEGVEHYRDETPEEIDVEAEYAKMTDEQKMDADFYLLDQARNRLAGAKERRDKEGKTPERKDIIKQTEGRIKEIQARLDMNPVYRQQMTEAADYAASEKDRIAKKMEELGPSDSRMIFGGPGTIPIQSFSSDVVERNQYYLARRFYDDTEKMLRSPLKYDKERKRNGYWSGTKDKLTDPNFWMFGIPEIGASVELATAFKEIEKHIPDDASTEFYAQNMELPFLTDAQRELVDAYFVFQNAKMEREYNVAGGYKAGEIATESIKFMVEIALGTGASKKAVEKVANLMARKLTKDATSTAAGAIGRRIVSKVGNNVLGKTLKWGTSKASQAARSALALPIMPGTYAAIGRRMTEFDENGRTTSFGKAVREGTLDNFLETFTEQGSVVFDGIRAVSKTIPMNQIVKGMLGEDAARFFRQMPRGIGGNLLSKGLYHGQVGEVLEEFDNAIYDYLRGNNDAIRDFVKMDNLLQLNAAFAGMTMFGAGLNAASTAKINYDYRKSEDNLRKQLGANGYTEDQINFIIDTANNGTKKDLSSLLANVLTHQYSQQAFGGAAKAVLEANDKNTELVKSVFNFMKASMAKTATNGINEGQQDERIEQERQALQQELGGHQFWQTSTAQSGNFDGTTAENVVIATVHANPNAGLEEGQTVFLTSTPDPTTGEMGYVTEDGRTGFIKADGIIPVQQNGVNAMAVEHPLREYLSYRIMQRDAQQEQGDFAAQRQQQVDQLSEQYQVGDTITIDSMQGEIVGKDADGIQISFVDDKGREIVRPYKWEEIAQKQGTPMQVRTEEEEIAGELGEQEAMDQNVERVSQIVRDNADRFSFVDEHGVWTIDPVNPIVSDSLKEDGTVKIRLVSPDGFYTYRDVNLNDLAKPAEAPAEGVPGEVPVAETPQEPQYEIPHTKDGEIDYDKLMEENPAEFARVNDEEMQDNGESTKTLFKNRVAELNKELKKNQENLAKQSKPSEMKKYQRKVADIQDKIAKLQSVLDGYNVAAQAPAAPVAEQPVSPVAEAPAAPAPEVVETPTPAPAPEPAPSAGRTAKFKAKRYTKLLSQLGDPLDFMDYAMRLIAGDSIRFKWKADPNHPNIRGLGDLFGYSATEQKKHVNILRDADGLYLDEAIETIFNAYAEERGVDVGELEIDLGQAAQVVEGIILGFSVKEMVDEIQRRHAEADYDPMQDEDYAKGLMEAEAAKYGMTIEEYQDFAADADDLGVGTDELFERDTEDGAQDLIIEKLSALSEDEWEEYENQLADEYIARQIIAGEEAETPGDNSEDSEVPVDNETDGEQPVAGPGEAGPAVLPGEQPTDGGVRSGDEVGRQGAEGEGRDSGSNEVPGGSVRGGAAETAEEVAEQPVPESADVENIPEMPEELQEEAAEAEAEEEQPVAEEEAPQEEEFVPTEEQIRDADIPEELKTMALAYLNGDRSFANTIAYQNALIEIQKNAGDSTQTGAADSSDAGSAQVDGGTDETSSAGVRQGGEPAGGLAGEGGTEDVSGNDGGRRVRGRKNRPSHGVPSSGVQGDSGVAGGEPGLFDEPSDGGRTDVGSTGRGDGRDVRGEEAGGNGSADAGEAVQRGSEAGSVDVDSEIESLKGELSDLWKDFTKAGQSNLSLSIVGMNGEQIQILGKILATAARLGYQFLKKGFRSLQNFRNKLREVIGDPLKKIVGYSDAEIDEFINEIWDAPYTMNGETHKISEWASIIGQEELRNEMRRSLEEKRELQKKAEKIPVQIADEDNIRETLPFLLPAQREDVRRAEVQFFDESHNDRDHAFGKGYMFTNGTGTGKTYTGLGIAKRFIKQGKTRILILTPSQEKVSDWVRDAENLQISLTKLDDTKDKGTGPVVTTYANFRQNKSMLEDTFDLVIYDESHRIMENQEGEASIGTKMHYMLSNKNADSALDRLQAVHPLWIREDELREDIKAIEEKISNSEDYGEIATLEAALTKKQTELDAVKDKQEAELPALREKAAEAVPKTKVVFLSATPFNTVKNLRYAEGYIFSYPEEDEATKGTSRHRTAEEAFMEQWFGSMISYKGGKQIESIENEDAVTKQEIAFSDYLQNTLQTMNGRIIDSEYDYSRDFPLVEVSMANEFNTAMEDIVRDPVLRILNDSEVSAFSHLDDYNWSTFLFEAMKVAALLPRIREHLKMGRKLVIFHRRINAPGQRPESENTVGRRKKAYPPMQPPFALGLQQAMEFAASTRDAGKAAKVMMAVQRFKDKYASLLQWEQTLDYRSVREQLIDAFATDKDKKQFAEEHDKWEKKAAEARKNGKKEPAEPTLKASRIALFSGQESKGAKHKDVEAFNSDEGKEIIIVQEASGKEGISLHDQTGKGHQRVIISLALPQSPITFIQIEGRIYRIGNMSNAIFEYPLLGINKELQLFAGKFNSRAGTTENLALGSLGRGLKRAIAQGVIEHQGVIPLEGQGIGGKEFDARQSTDGGKTGYDGAISDYYTNVKQNSGRDNRDGVDYFPTPEPIGFKMVEWAKIGEGESVLEPSAGHGAIARYVPTANELTAIEPSQALNARLAILIGGGNRTIKESEFEDYNIINKHDVVVMNPPYGTAGKTAGEHLEKAFDHLNEGGRLIAIIPDGPAMDKRVEKWSGEHPEAVVVGEVKLPSVAFDRAGTSVRTRILVIDKVSRAEARKTVPEKQTYDFSDVEKIDDLFEKMRHVNMPDRTIDQIAIKSRIAKRLLPEFKKIEDVVQKKSDFNEVNEQGIRLDIPYARYNRMYIPLNGKFKWDDNNRRHAVLEINFNEMEPLTREVAQKYKRVQELMDLDDSLFARRATNNAWSIEDEEVEPLRQFYKIYMKAVRDLSGLTEAQILRVADGLSPDISPADISGDLTMDDLREKFDVANGNNEERKELFDRVYSIAKQLGLNINVYRSNGDDVANYNIADNSLNINALKWNRIDNDKRAQTILHEMIHSVTSYALFLYEMQQNMTFVSAEQERIADEVLTPEIQQACADLNAVYRLIMSGEESRHFAGQYGLTDAHEMVAELANPAFRAKLKARNLWKRIVNGIKRLLGFAAENAEQTTAEKETLAALDTLLDNFTPENYEKARTAVNQGHYNVVKNLEIPEPTKEEQSQADVVYAKAMLDGSLGIAPNGKKSNLDPEQWALVRTDRFKGFFGDWVNDSKNASKVVDENGEPRVVYHGTKHKFWTFDGGKSRARYTDGLNYFALDKQFAEDWVHRDDDWQRDQEDTDKIESERLRSLEHKREAVKPLVEKYGDKYWDTDEYRELEKEFDQWERDNLDLGGMTVKEAGYNYGKRLLGCFINARNPYNPTEMYDTVGKEMLQRLGVLEQNPEPMSEFYARGGAYIYYERKEVVDELKRLGYDGIYLSENVYSDPSKNLRTIAVWDSDRIKLADPTTYDDNGDEISIDDRFTESGDIRYRRGDGTAGSEDTAGIESAVNETAEKLNTPVVIEHGTPAGVKKNALGWYDPSDGSVHVNVDAAKNAADAIATVLHEVVGHNGLRKLLGDRFDKAMDTLRSMATKEIRDKIDAIAKEQGVDALTAMEEYLAQLAENGATNNEELSFWEKAKAFFRSLLRSIGIDMGEITEADLNYIIWASRRNLEQNGGDLLRAADNAIIRSAMKQMAQDSHHEVQRETPERLYRDGGNTTEYAKAVIARQYEKRIAEGGFFGYQFREAMQDSMLSLRDFMLMTLKAEGKDTKYIEDVPGFENAYLSENALSSKTKIEQDTFGKLLFEPLVNEIAQLANTAEERQELTDYMMAKHGLERNEKFAQRDAIRFYKNIMDATIEAAKKDKSLDDQARADAIDAAEAEFEAHKHEIEAGQDKKYKEFRKKDYSGLTALTGTDNVSDAESKAKDMVHDYEFDHDTNELWKKTKDVTSAIMKKMGEGGIVTRTAAKEITDMFDYYIPLRGFDETTSDEAYAYLDDAHGPLNSPILPAGGRESKADDPIATLANMADTAIMQSNKNEMKQKFLNFVLNHPTDLVSVNDLWIQFNDVTGEWEAVFADIKEGDAPAIVDQKVQDFEQHMQELAEQEPDKYKKAKDAKNIPYRVINGHLKEHQILIKRIGKTYVLTVNGNPRLAQALNGETNPDAQTKGVLGAVGRIAKSATTTLSQLYTTRNPEFIASNFMRDAIYANSMAWIKENPKYAANFNKNFGRVNPVRMLSLLSKFEKNELDMSNPVEKAFQEFMMNGGETGYTNVKDIEKQKKEIGKQIKKMQGRMPIAKAMDVLGDEMDLLNRAVENCARFAAFLTSREQGRDLERSIYDAKEISVNFNKKGAGDRFYRGTGQTWWGNAGAFMSGAGREFYAFWNAGLQGTTNFARAAKRHPYKFGFGAAAMFTIGALMPMMYQYLFGGDDDDKDNYYNLPEYIRRSNICFKAGDKWITIPLPIEMRAIYGLGELAAGQMMGQEGYDAQELAYQIGSQVSQVLPLDMLEGGGGLHALIPTGLKPVAEAYMNKKWTGLPLYQQKSQWNEDMPEWTKAFKSANPLIVNMTAELNGLTAEYGDKYEKGVVNLNPARIEYMLNGYFGGYATTAQALVKMAEMGIDGEWNWSNALIARRFLKSADETTEYRKLNNEYYELRDEYEHVKKQLKRYETNEDTERQNKLEASDKYKRYEIMAGPSSIDGDKSYYQKIDELNRAMKNAEDPEDAVELEKEKYDLIRDLMKEIHALDKKEKGKD